MGRDVEAIFGSKSKSILCENADYQQKGFPKVSMQLNSLLKDLFKKCVFIVNYHTQDTVKYVVCEIYTIRIQSLPYVKYNYMQIFGFDTITKCFENK